MAVGLALATGGPLGSTLEALVHLLVLASVGLLVGAALVPVRLPPREALSTVVLMGVCHGVLHGEEVGAASALWFGLGALVSAAVLAVAGVALGRVVARAA
ncbi:hypothetical protein Rumeso_00877 [Rubellimicrobium mesophilum DSM 19309]|uniref:HupE-UreJ family metal transporter n=2 Tax=Rubellimicrobium TaxID=295418 RepID=A0A017HUX4_9RHOB|nr:hypothetical protein Rumeso_00877 [Rubellimicrobium mesophilum DSM 19309]